MNKTSPNLIGVGVFAHLLVACGAAQEEVVPIAADRVFVNGAYQMRLENEQGSIGVGKRADLIVLDRNLFEIRASEISDAKVTMTIFDGRTVY
jgi:imidazolonepropionase-like amidohydrolase